ncbi:hypothetical protein [Sphingosinithalassobacter portus]|uniref:hypothetical protein n=1 Tax=Stakelama portus TaxID=2676234 RepID=UPI000D6DCDEA|nr:hypothetical protein [Sphingosinithalassobacter portus]
MLTISILIALLGAQSVDDPLAPAREGKLQCYSPDTAAKTCQALAGYELAEDGTYRNTATVLIAPTPAVTMTTVSPVTVKDGAVCGYNRVEDLEASEISVDAMPIPEAQASAVRAQIIQALAPMIGPELCTRYTPDGDGLRAEVSFDGVARPEFNTRVIWVSPDEGYRVAP